jgi:hypothetical protein
MSYGNPAVNGSNGGSWFSQAFGGGQGGGGSYGNPAVSPGTQQWGSSATNPQQGMQMYGLGIGGQLANTQMQQSGGLDRELAALPILANMSNGLSGGGMAGFQSTNSPQAASLPGSAAGGSAGSGAAFGGIDPNSYIQKTLGQLGGAGGGPNMLSSLGYSQGGYTPYAGSAGLAGYNRPSSTGSIAQMLGY